MPITSTSLVNPFRSLYGPNNTPNFRTDGDPALKVKCFAVFIQGQAPTVTTDQVREVGDRLANSITESPLATSNHDINDSYNLLSCADEFGNNDGIATVKEVQTITDRLINDIGEYGENGEVDSDPDYLR